MRTSNIVISLGVAFLCAGCNSDPMPDDRAHNALSACCDEVRDKITNVNDVESHKFRARCLSCRQGNPKSQCESAARAIQQSVKEAYGTTVWPLSCTTLRSSMAEAGISLPKLD